MKKHFMKRLIGVGFMSVMLAFGCAAEAGVVTDRVPIQLYVDHRVNTYNSPGASNAAGYIAANTDLIQVTQIRADGWAYGNYPGAGGRRVSRWFRISDLCADTGYSNRGVRVSGYQAVYTTSGSNTQFGSVNNEDVIVLANNGSRAQILYNVSGGYKIGWVASSAIDGGGDGNLKGDVNGDGKVDASDLTMLEQFYIGNRSSVSCPKNADMNGDGRHTLTDVTRLEMMLKSSEPRENEVNPSLQGLINTWNNTTWKNHTYLGTVKECKEFASFIFNKIYGVGYIGGGSTSGNPQNYLITLSNPNRVGLRGYKTALSASSAQQLFANARSGDFVQIRRRTGGPHSAIFVKHTADGIVLFEANADGRNSIRTNTYSYSALASRNYAMSVYYAK